MFERILIVCTGNICRSPMAEYLLKNRLTQCGRQAQVRSAGIGALVNAPADPLSAEAMRGIDIDLSAHRAQQVNLEMTRWAELILVMEPHHREAIIGLDPTARGKTFLLGHWSGNDVPDPYRLPSTAHTASLELIDKGLAAWLERLC